MHQIQKMHLDQRKVYSFHLMLNKEHHIEKRTEENWIQFLIGSVKTNFNKG